jgi:hypothetical protein
MIILDRSKTAHANSEHPPAVEVPEHDDEFPF